MTKIKSFKIYTDDTDEDKVLVGNDLNTALEILENNGYIVEAEYEEDEKESKNREQLIIKDDQGRIFEFETFKDLIEYADSFLLSWLPDDFTWKIIDETKEKMNVFRYSHTITSIQNVLEYLRESEVDGWVDLKSGLEELLEKVEDEKVDYSKLSIRKEL